MWASLAGQSNADKRSLGILFSGTESNLILIFAKLRWCCKKINKSISVGDNIKLRHWFPKFPFLSLLSNLIKDCLKYENRMRLVGTPFVPPPPHHHHWHYFDITKLPYQKQYPICYKSLRKWKFHWWVDFRIYDGVPPFLEWIWRNPVFLSIGGEFMMSAHHMMGFHHMMHVLPIKW